ncbi:hypothetical protein PA598K_00391 [Paenibacillus sp. 598K]|uniref:Ger(x)C family spore germination protein n=1 Tax=Paenibacillus sp. 598K TaxID=1117987 RepID=UPI000FF95E3D|nr:Ger(x)C family spore germination protein [Paenibacillus sp. 598K]GBF72154.1 hypothetical protein PA598K_00391 [Paenibacillus sp. 598K]
MTVNRLILIPIILGLAILPGCWSRKELNELAVIMALGIDKDDKGYMVTAQVINPSEIGLQRGSVGASPVIVYSAPGQTIPDALQRILSQAPRKLYLSHMRVLIFGEALARDGLSDVLDYISRNSEFRTDFYLAVTQGGKAADVLQVLTPFEHIPANSLYSSILVSNKQWAATGKVTLQQFVTELSRDGANPVMSGVEISGDKQQGKTVSNLHSVKPKAQLRHAGLALFKGDKLVGWADESTSKSINYLLRNVHTTVGYVKCPKHKPGIVGISINQSSAHIRVKLNQEGEPEFWVDFQIDADLEAVQCSIDLTQEESFRLIEIELKEAMRVLTLQSINTIREKYGTDVFGFGEALHRKYPKQWNKYRDHWSDKFRQVQISIEPHVSLRRIGSIGQPLRSEVHE